MPLVTSALDDAVNGVTAALTHLSLHTADPGETGANEAAGGAPAYARKAVVYAATADGKREFSGVTWDVPAGTYSHVGGWSALSGGAWKGSKALSTPIVVGAQGQVSISAGRVRALAP